MAPMSAPYIEHLRKQDFTISPYALGDMIRSIWNRSVSSRHQTPVGYAHATVTRVDGSTYKSVIIKYYSSHTRTEGYKYSTIGKSGKGPGCYDWDTCPYRPGSYQSGNSIHPDGEFLPIPAEWLEGSPS